MQTTSSFDKISRPFIWRNYSNGQLYDSLSPTHHEETDKRTIGELFYLMVSELNDLTFAEAIAYLVNIFKGAFEKKV